MSQPSNVPHARCATWMSLYCCEKRIHAAINRFCSLMSFIPGVYRSRGIKFCTGICLFIFVVTSRILTRVLDVWKVCASLIRKVIKYPYRVCVSVICKVIKCPYRVCATPICKVIKCPYRVCVSLICKVIKYPYRICASLLCKVIKYPYRVCATSICKLIKHPYRVCATSICKVIKYPYRDTWLRVTLNCSELLHWQCCYNNNNNNNNNNKCVIKSKGTRK
jgi:hypothetical protein